MQQIYEQAKKCKEASYELCNKSSEQKNDALKQIIKSLREGIKDILAANKIDIENAHSNKKEAFFIDRLTFDESRINDMIDGINQVIQLDDPCHRTLNTWKNGELTFVKKSVAIGVIGIIYEARPNVSVDAASLCLKSGNVCYLRGSKDAIETNKVLVSLMQKGLQQADFNENCIALVMDTTRDAANIFMKMNDYLDLLIPRGSAQLIQSCVQNASVPIIETGSGNCHIYVDKQADISKAIEIIINAKCQRISVCNTCESLLLHQDIVDNIMPSLLKAFEPYKVLIHGDDQICKFDHRIIKATKEDYAKEYLNYEISIKTVNNLHEAINHINHYHTMHSDAIISTDGQAIETFMNNVDSAVVYANASTRFSDGNEFGFGAEIGISTQKMHARGPMGLDALTTYKYQVYGNGTTRK